MAFDLGAVVGHVKLDSNEFSKSSAIIQKGFKKIQTGAIVAGAAIATAFTKSIIEANKFQKAFSNVTTVIDTTAINTQALALQLINLDSSLGSTTELTNGLYQAFSAGAKTAEEALNITTQSAKLAKAALVDTNTAVDILTTAVNAYGKENITATQASDIFFNTIKQGKITGEELSSTIGQSISLFASAGIGLDQLASAMAAMTKVGVQSSETTTQLNAIINAFLKPSQAMTTALENMGFESGSALLKAEGLVGALDLLKTATNGDSEALSELLPNIRAAKGAMALTGEGGKEFKIILDSMAESVGATDEAFKKQEKTFATFGNELNKLFIVVGNIGKSFADDIVGGATDALEATRLFVQSTEGMNLVSAIIGSISGSFQVLKMVLEPMVNSLFVGLSDITGSIAEGFSKLLPNISGTTAIFNVLSGVSKSVALVLNVITKSISVQIKFWLNFYTAVKEAGLILVEFFKSVKSRDFIGFKNQIKATGNAVKDLAKETTFDIADMFVSAAMGAKDLFTTTDDLGSDMESSFKQKMANATSFVSNAWGELITGQIDQTNGFLAEYEKANQGLIDSTNQTGQQLKTSWSNTFGSLWANLRETANQFGMNSNQYKQSWSEFTDFMASSMQNAAMHISSVLTSLSGIFNQYYTNQLTRLDNRYVKEKEAIENSLLTEEEKTAKLEELEEGYRKKQAEIKKKQFEANKKASILEATINTAIAVTRALTAGPIIGPILAGIIAGLGAAQIGLIASQPTPEYYAKGGVANTGLAIVGEEGPELMDIGTTSRIYPADETSKMLGSGKVEINNTFTGPVNSELDMQRSMKIAGYKYRSMLRSA